MCSSCPMSWSRLARAGPRCTCWPGGHRPGLMSPSLPSDHVHWSSDHVSLVLILQHLSSLDVLFFISGSLPALSLLLLMWAGLYLFSRAPTGTSGSLSLAVPRPPGQVCYLSFCILLWTWQDFEENGSLLEVFIALTRVSCQESSVVCPALLEKCDPGRH